MNKKISTILAALVLLIFSATLWANSMTGHSEDVTEVLTLLKKKVQARQKEMLADYPKFGSISKINKETVAKACEILEGGNMYDMKLSVELNTSYTQICIYNWYINSINTEKTPATKQELANEFQELEKLMDVLSSIKGDMASTENFGGSMARLDYNCGVDEVYTDWFSALQKKPRPTQRATSEDARIFLEKQRNEWKGTYEVMAEDELFEEEIYQTELKNLNEQMLEYLDELSALFAKKNPFCWVIKKEETPAPAPKDEKRLGALVPAGNNEAQVPVYAYVEQMPSFPQGDAALMKYIYSNIKSPSGSGKKAKGTVKLRFVVNENGSVGDVQILSSDADSYYNDEVKRVAKSLPRFIAGRQGGKSVKVWYSLQIRLDGK